ncbi:MAG: hypothetical protein RIR12_1236 [Bacteroidota bacterium]|jgi:hypothetical protein
MKHLSLMVVATIFSVALYAQSEKYVKAMEALTPRVDTLLDKAGFIELANSFERIGNAEKTEWLPYYYAALAQVNAGYTFAMDGGFGDKTADIDPIADKAEELITKAAAISQDNSEIWVIKKMIASLKMMGNPMARYQEYGAKATVALETAKKLNPENPRVYMLEGQDLFYTPEEFGGDKQEAKVRFQTSLEKFKVQKPASTIHPAWGMGSVMYFMSQVK